MARIATRSGEYARTCHGAVLLAATVILAAHESRNALVGAAGLGNFPPTGKAAMPAVRQAVIPELWIAIACRESLGA